MALTTAQQALLLFKKWLGLGQTTASREFFNETAYPGRVAVYTNQIWTQADSIPNTAPVLTNGQTSGVVQYWQNAPLGAVPGTTNAFTSSLLRDAIPFNYGDGSSYNYVIRNNVGTTIAFGEGDWIVDTDAGLVTFYSTVPANMPPNISFYKYVGAKGFTSASVALTGSLLGTSSVAISASFVQYTNIGNLPSLVSSSTQINTGSFTGSFTGDGSQLTGVVATGVAVSVADDGVVQGSAGRLDFGNFITATTSANTASIAVTLPVGTVSSSLQINTGSFSGSFVGSFAGTSSFANNSTSSSLATSASFAVSSSRAVTASFAISSAFAPTNVGVVSSSAQISYTQLQNIPSGIVSSSTQVTSFLPSGVVSSSLQINTGSFSGSFTGTLVGTSSWATNAITASYTPPSFIDNLVTVGLPGSNTNFTTIKSAVDSITDASATNTYTVRVYPGVYIEDTITLKPYIAIKGDSSISTIVSASNPNNSIFVMADQTMVIDMQIQGSTGTNTSAVIYSSPTTPQTNAIAYVENVRFGTNYTNAKVVGSGSSGNCILQCSNVKYGGFTSGSKSFDVGFYVTSGSDGGIGRMQLRNVTSTNGGVAGTDNDQIFALADAPGCTFIVNGCLLTRATGTARGTAFKVYNGGQLRLTGVNFQRWIRGIWAPQTGSAPSIDAIALNFENCTTDVQIDHTGSLGKISGTDNFLKTIIAKDAPLYEVNQDPRRISVAKKGGDFTSISASVAYITDSTENNRYIIEVGPGEFTENQIDLRGKPYVAIRGSDIQTTVIIQSGSGTFDQLIIGPTNEVSFLTLQGNNVAGYSAVSMPDVGQVVGTDFAMAHKISIYDYDYGIKVCADTANSTFYGEYIDINGMFSYGLYVSSSNNFSSLANIENYYLFPSNSSGIGNYVVGPSSSLGMYTGLFVGDNTAGSTAIKIERGATLEAAALDMQNWDYGVRVPAQSPAPEFRIVGSMIHNSNIYDFDVLNTSTRGRFQGVASHEKINNLSPEFFWNFLDDTDGENDITRKLSVTFADGTHTDATTLIFKGSPMGVLEGGMITTSSGLTVTTAAGYGYLSDVINPEVFKRFDWVDSNITLAANSNNYLFINSSGVLSASPSTPNFTQNIILGRVHTNDTGVEFIDQSSWNAEHTANRLSKFTREALGPVYADGSIVTEDVIPFRLDVTAGSYYFAENNFTPSGTSSINLAQYYPSASTWVRYTSSVVPNNTYASSSQLVPMSASAYTKHTVYAVGDGVDEKYFLVINTNQYDTLVQAENAALPTIPTYFDDGVVPLAAVYVQSGSANITQIQDIRPIIGFRAAGVNASSVHGNLLGLSADDHPQYLLVNGTRAMAGNLSMGGNNITNIGTLIGTSSWANNAVTASAATSITFTPATASFATTASAATSITFTPTTASFAVSSSRAITSSFAISSSFAPTILPDGVISSSTQVNYTQLQNIPIGIVSSSTQVAVLLPAGTVSSSLQINTGSFSGSFTGTLLGTSSWANNATSASYAVTASYVSGSSNSALSSSYAATASQLSTQTVVFSSSITPTWSTITSNSQHLSEGTYALTSNITASPINNVLVSGIFSWYTGPVESNDSDELFLQRTGRTASSASIFMRTQMISGSGSFLQIASDYSLPINVNTFTFVKLI